MMDWTSPDQRPIEGTWLKGPSDDDFLAGWSGHAGPGDDPGKMTVADVDLARALGGLPPIRLGPDARIVATGRASHAKCLTLRGEMTTRIQAGNARTTLQRTMAAMEAVLRVGASAAECPPGKAKAHVAVYDNDEAGRLQAYAGITVMDGIRPNYPAPLARPLWRWLLAGALSARAAGHAERNWTEPLRVPTSASARAIHRSELLSRRAEDAATIAAFLREIGLEDEAGNVQDAVTSLGPQGPSFLPHEKSFLLPAAYAARSTGQPRRSSG